MILSQKGRRSHTVFFLLGPNIVCFFVTITPIFVWPKRVMKSVWPTKIVIDASLGEKKESKVPKNTFRLIIFPPKVALANIYRRLVIMTYRVGITLSNCWNVPSLNMKKSKNICQNWHLLLCPHKISWHLKRWSSTRDISPWLPKTLWMRKKEKRYACLPISTTCIWMACVWRRGRS